MTLDHIITIAKGRFTNGSRLNDYIILVSFESNEVGHKHHILPRCFFKDYTNVASNIVKLSYDDHIKAHTILVEIVKTNSERHKMISALNYLLKGLRIRTPEFLQMMKEINTGENNPMYGVRGENNPNFGKSLTHERKLNISRSLMGEKHPYFGKNRPEETKTKISVGNKGKLKTEEHCRNISISKQGKQFPNWGGNNPEETKRKISEKVSGVNNGCYGKTKASNPNAKPVEIEGIRFECLLDAAEHFAVHKKTIIAWLKKGKGKYLPKATLLDNPPKPK